MTKVKQNLEYFFTFLTGLGAVGARDQQFVCRDASGDGTVDISDAVYLIPYIFAGGSAPCAGCM